VNCNLSDSMNRIVRRGMARYAPTLLMLLLFISPIHAQDEEYVPFVTTAFRDATLYEGPGDTYFSRGVLGAGIEVTILERNAIGNWLYVERTNRSGIVTISGWVLTGYLNTGDTIPLSEVPINTDVRDAAPQNVNSQSMRRLYAIPIIPEVSAAMHAVYALGQEHGNDSHTVTKVGDSLSAGDGYLTVMSSDNYDLNPYDYLEETFLYFRDSLAEPSVSAQIGMSSFVIFDPMWANAELCEGNESPLECEYRRKQPAIAMIMFGPNDVRAMDTETYTEQMSQIVEDTLELGIIPVLSTFSCDPDEEFFWQSINFNLALIDIANEYQVPLINLWAAARVLPNYGLDEDRIHLLTSGFDHLYYPTGHEAWYGVSLQNLLALRTWYEIYTALDME
jgi:hypothetical protein